MTHNTREGIEAWKDINCLEGECAECGGTGEGADNPCSDHGETYPCYVCNGTGSWSVYRKKDVDKFLHQELQKARHDWLREEIMKLEGMKKVAQDKDGLLFSETNYNQALQTIIDRYQSELDQPNK